MILMSTWVTNKDGLNDFRPATRYNCSATDLTGEDTTVVRQSPSFLFVRISNEEAQVLIGADPDDGHAILCDIGESMNEPPTSIQLADMQRWLGEQGYEDVDRDAMRELLTDRTRQQILDDLNYWMVTP